MVSTIVVGILFITAVVASLYAQSIDLGVDEFDSAMLLAPVATEAADPPQPAAPRTRSQMPESDVPHRQSNTQRTEESPSDIPPISTTPNTKLSRPRGYFEFTTGPETNSFGSRGTGNAAGSGEPQGTGSADTRSEPVAKTDAESEPPPPKAAVVKPPPIKSEGVINGKAKYLPPPPYPPAAKAVGAEGNVDVQVTIDEAGNVISSHAVSGHPLLRQAAEKAAWNAKFSTTYLSRVPVKVTGVIVYKFARN